MLTTEVRDNALRLSLEDREELASVLVESLREDGREVEVEIDLDAMANVDEAEDSDEVESPASRQV